MQYIDEDKLVKHIQKCHEIAYQIQGEVTPLDLKLRSILMNAGQLNEIELRLFANMYKVVFQKEIYQTPVPIFTLVRPFRRTNSHDYEIGRPVLLTLVASDGEFKGIMLGSAERKDWLVRRDFFIVTKEELTEKFIRDYIQGTSFFEANDHKFQDFRPFLSEEYITHLRETIGYVHAEN